MCTVGEPSDTQHRAFGDAAKGLKGPAVGGVDSGAVGDASCRFLVVGAGITGLTIARELLRRGADDVLLLEKEDFLGRHASGRNSGVLHAGIYYTPDTLKARFCIRGNRLMKSYCRERGLVLRETGKVIVARTPEEVPLIHELKRRADAAGARSSIIDERELSRLEPHAATCGWALHALDTAVVHPKEILEALAADIKASGRARISFGTTLVGREGRRSVRTSSGVISYERMVNAAGAYADRVARLWGLTTEYRFLPFKGTYRELIPGRRHLVRGNIYPVPDLGQPFLGVHLTRTADDHVYAGPTAIPAFGRENYRFLDGWDLETPAVLLREGVLLLTDRGFRRAALSESRKYIGRFMFREAQRLVPALEPGDLTRSEKVGVRPQLVHWREKKLVMDFVVLAEEDGVHVLNAISPAFTSSMAFAEYVVDLLSTETGGVDAFRGRET